MGGWRWPPWLGGGWKHSYHLLGEDPLGVHQGPSVTNDFYRRKRVEKDTTPPVVLQMMTASSSLVWRAQAAKLQAMSRHQFPMAPDQESFRGEARMVASPGSPPMHLMGSWEAEPHIAAINAYWDTRSWGASSSGSQDSTPHIPTDL